MSIAVWGITRNGCKKAMELGESLKCDNFYLKKYLLEKGIPFENLNDALCENFSKYNTHIFIMATGIVIRGIKDYIKDKTIDPGVIVIDENFTFAISLLSGHIGGANEFAIKLADKFSLFPIITTSSDITGKIAVDTLSEKLKCNMRDLKESKEVTALIVDNQKVELLLPKNMHVNFYKETTDKNSSSQGLIFLSNQEKVKVTQIYPKNIILGIGCRKGVSKEIILEAIETGLEKVNISKKSIKHMATVSLKKDEEGIIESCKELGISLKILENNEINSCEFEFIKSDFVNENVGVKAVSAPCAYLTSSKKGEFLLEKFIHKGVTLSIYQEEN